MYKAIPEELKEALEQERLLIISTSTAVRQSKITALARNRYICELADDILFVGVTENSSLYHLKQEYIMKSISPSSITSTADAKHHRSFFITFVTDFWQYCQKSVIKIEKICHSRLIYMKIERPLY